MKLATKLDHVHLKDFIHRGKQATLPLNEGSITVRRPKSESLDATDCHLLGRLSCSPQHGMIKYNTMPHLSMLTLFNK